MVCLVDWAVGQIMEILEQFGVTERTPLWRDLRRGCRGCSPFVAIGLEVEPLEL